MKSSFLLISIFSLFLIATRAIAIDLEAPAEKKITVRSEVERGYSAVFDSCSLHSSAIMEIEDCVFKILERNKQKNTDTEAFLLGTYYEAWSDITIALEVIKDRPDRESRFYGHGIDIAKLFYKLFRKRQNDMGIDDITLSNLVHKNYEAKNRGMG
jgi:hypothetical protein